MWTWMKKLLKPRAKNPLAFVFHDGKKWRVVDSLDVFGQLEADPEFSINSR